jgi:putative transposase
VRARLLRSTLPDGFFHAYARAVEGAALFSDDEDRRWFLACLSSTARRHAWEVHALWLMTTHYHLVLESEREQLSAGMRRLNGIYGQSFNRRYGRSGHLFGARFGSRAIETDENLERVCQYVLLNPVRAGLCVHAAEWPWNGSKSGFPAV